MKGKKDVVYILKADAPSEELRYSLRSIVRNFKFRKVWFYCGCPEGLTPDEHVPFEQIGRTRFERSCSTLRAICENDDITEDFYLFNDDFFVMAPYEQDLAIVQGSIYKHFGRIVAKRKSVSPYAHRLMQQHKWLRKHGFTALDYATHTPLPVNRKKAIELLDLVEGEKPGLLFRNLYGNYANVPYTVMKDCKALLVEDKPNPDSPLLSTRDITFTEGKAGEYIRSVFKRRCRYEK